MKRSTKKSCSVKQAKATCPVRKFSALATNEWGQDFITWLIVEKGCDARYAKDTTYNANRLMVRTNTVRIVAGDPERIAAWIHGSEFSKSHKRHMLRALEYYLEFLGVRDPRGDFYKFKKPTVRGKVPKYLTQEDMRRLIRGAKDYRELAMLSVFCTAGLRLSELSGLNIEDMDFDGMKIKVRHAKFDKQREVPLSAEIVPILRNYIEAYHGDTPKPATPFFESIRGNRWSCHAIGSALAMCGERAGLKQKVTPHMLRHSFATAMVGNGCDLFHLSKMLGHTDLATTQIYLHVVGKAMREQYDMGVPSIL